MELVIKEPIGYVRIYVNDGIKTADEFFAAIKDATVAVLIRCEECEFWNCGRCTNIDGIYNFTTPHNFCSSALPRKAFL